MGIINKQIFLNNLPRYRGSNIDWLKSIDYEVDFIYGNIKGRIKIISYNKTSHKVTISYLSEIFEIATQAFMRCGLGELLQTKTIKYKYNKDDIVNNMKILECIKMKKATHMEKGYKILCLECSYKGNIYETMMSHNCPACCNRRISKGINDIATTHPHLVKYFKNIDDAYKYSSGMNNKIHFKCPDCGFEKEMIASDLIKSNGFSCPKCGDGNSFPEKFIFKMFEQLLEDNFIYHKTFSWSQRKEYDFYISNFNILLEANGMQHYKETYRKGARTLEEEQTNDKLKKQLALFNGIKEENYIIIDCRYSTLEFVKQNILESNLAKIFDLNKIDWSKCFKFALSNLVKVACEYWNNGIHSTKEISDIMNISQSRIIGYLNKGYKANLCNYVGNKNRHVQIYNLNNEFLDEFNNVPELCILSEKLFGVKFSRNMITSVCRGDQKTHKGFIFKYALK